MSTSSDALYLRHALAAARAAQAAGEVPVGAVVVHQGRIIATGHNACIVTHDVSAHAEIVALRRAGAALGNYRLAECEVFVTLEPCIMCAGALAQARVARVVYAAADPRAGAAGSVMNIFANPVFNHHTQVTHALQAADFPATDAAQLQALLPDFFAARRAQQNKIWPLRADALRTQDEAFTPYACEQVQSHFVQHLPALAGLRLHYGMRAARVPPQRLLVCLHSPSRWSYAFHDFAAHAAPDCCVLMPDLPGSGQSDKPKKTSAHSLAWHAQVLSEWLAYAQAAQGLQGLPLELVLDTPAHPLLPLLRAQLPQLQGAPVLISTAPNPAADSAPYAPPYADKGYHAAQRFWQQAT